MSDIQESLPDEPASVDDLTVLGLLFLPVVFVWFLLNPRYSSEIRIGAAAYAVLATAGLLLTLGDRLF